MSPVEVYCPHCRAGFEAPDSQKAGLASCPECQKAVPVPGGPEPLFWLLLVGVVVFGFGGSAFLFFQVDTLLGITVFVVTLVAVVSWLLTG